MRLRRIGNARDLIEGGIRGFLYAYKGVWDWGDGGCGIFCLLLLLVGGGLQYWSGGRGSLV